MAETADEDMYLVVASFAFNQTLILIPSICNPVLPCTSPRWLISPRLMQNVSHPRSCLLHCPYWLSVRVSVRRLVYHHLRNAFLCCWICWVASWRINIRLHYKHWVLVPLRLLW